MRLKNYVVNTLESYLRITLQQLTIELRWRVTLYLRLKTT